MDLDDSTNKRMWGGTKAQYFELYDIAAKHLKKCFPHLKFGGPSLAGRREWAEDFLKQLNAPLDFFSWHSYNTNVETLSGKIMFFRELLDKYGFTQTENILDEMNYIKDWRGDDFVKSVRTVKGLKGASYTAGVMCASQYLPLDMLMYYDARPSRFNGMFDTDIVSVLLKGYYPFKMFNELYKKGNAIKVENIEENNIYAAAAKGQDGEVSIMLTYFDDEEKEAFKDVEIELCDSEGTRKAEIYLLDENNDMELVKTQEIENKINLKMTLFSTVLVNLK